MTGEVYGAIITLLIGVACAALILGGRRFVEWWAALPARERPQSAITDRLVRAWRVWLMCVAALIVGAYIEHNAPRSGSFEEIELAGLAEAIAYLKYASRAGFGFVVASAANVLLWPGIGIVPIIWPKPDSKWQGVPVPLKCVVLAGWFGLYLLLVAGALSIGWMLP